MRDSGPDCRDGDAECETRGFRQQIVRE